MTSPEQYFFCLSATPQQMDAHWAEGWRHFGMLFFRYRTSSDTGSHCTVMPLRVDLERFSLSRSQKRILARNRDTRVVIRDASITPDKRKLFKSHRRRFRVNVPDSLSNFLSHRPASVPCLNQEICVYLGNRLAAVSFLDIGARATSAVYAMFDPEEHRRSLGIFTMLLAIQHSRTRGCRYYYTGYACREPSVYDYKKNFSGLEYYNWRGVWSPMPAASEVVEESRA